MKSELAAHLLALTLTPISRQVHVELLQLVP